MTTPPESKRIVCAVDQALLKEWAQHPFFVVFTFILEIVLACFLALYDSLEPFTMTEFPLKTIVSNLFIFWTIIALFLAWIYRKAAYQVMAQHGPVEAILWRRVWPLRALATLFILAVFLLK